MHSQMKERGIRLIAFYYGIDDIFFSTSIFVYYFLPFLGGLLDESLGDA